MSSIASTQTTSSVNSLFTDALTNTTNTKHKHQGGIESLLQAVSSVDSSLASKLQTDIQSAAQTAAQNGTDPRDAIDAAIAKDLKGASSDVQNAITNALGKNIFDSSGSVDASALRSALAPKGHHGPPPPPPTNGQNGTSSTDTDGDTDSSSVWTAGLNLSA